MTYEEALHKMHNYGPDDEGEEAIEKLSEALEVLRILKKHARKISEVPGQEKEPDIQIIVMPEADEEYAIIKNWLEEAE